MADKRLINTRQKTNKDERVLGDGEFIHVGLDSIKHGEKIAKAEQLDLVAG